MGGGGDERIVIFCLHVQIWTTNGILIDANFDAKDISTQILSFSIFIVAVLLGTDI